MRGIIGKPHLGRIPSDDSDSPPSTNEPREGINFFLAEAEGPANERHEGETTTDEETQITTATPDQIAELFKKVKSIEGEMEDQTGFALREKSLPAPKNSGATILKPFPLSEEKRTQPAPISNGNGNLEIVRYLPEGELTEVAPRISITFSHTMVALGTIEDVANQNVPAKLTPQPEGRWRWLGTKTIVFEPSKHRFPSSTSFTVEIPAGTKGINGEALLETKAFSFSTPKVKVLQVFPRSTTQGLRAPMFVSFDQVINPQALLSSSVVHVSTGQRSFPLELLTQQEVDALEDIKRFARHAQGQKDPSQGRTWMAFRSTEELPYDSSIQITIGPKIPSSEGPLLDSSYSYTWSFNTYGPFKFLDAPNYEPVPNSELKIQLSNDIEEDSLVESDFKITPPITNLQIRVESSWLIFSGTTVRGSYAIKLPTSLRDVYGQNLIVIEPPITITVGPAQPNIFFQRQGNLIMDPSLEPQYLFSSVNIPKVHVVIRRMTHEDYAACPGGVPQVPWVQNKGLDYWMGKRGETVLDTIMDLNSPPDEYHTTTLKLRQYLQHPSEGTGHLLLGIQPTEARPNQEPIRSVSWLQFTKLGLEVYSNISSLIIWTNSLLDGSPVSGAKVWGPGLEASVVSGENGTVVTPAAGRCLVFASNGNDWTANPYHVHPNVPHDHSHAIFHVFDDRKLYKPKETVHIKGYIRTNSVSNNERTLSIPPPSELDWVATDSRGAQIGEGKFTTSKYGSFDFTISLPDTVNLGTASICISGPLGEGYHNFDIQEFRKPEFKSSAHAGSGPHLPNGSTVITANAQYYSGGNLTDAKVHWEVTSTAAAFTPPGWNGFNFGQRQNYRTCVPTGIELQRKEFDSKTDLTGSHYLDVSWTGAEKTPTPITINAEARITDLNNQAISSSTSFLVHPSSLYVGVKTDRCFVNRKTPLNLEIIVTSLDGTAVEGVSVNLVNAHHQEVYKRKQWREETTRTVTATLLSESRPVNHTLSFEEGGSYDLEVSIVDGKGNANLSSISIWVSGGPAIIKSVNMYHEAKIIADKEVYQPGDVAKLLVVPPFENAHGFYLVGTTGLEKFERFSVPSEGYTIEIPLTPKHIPTLTVIVDFFGATREGEGDDQHSIPARASISHQLTVSTDFYKLQIAAHPESGIVQPGGETEIRLEVQSNEGPSADAEVVVIVVDDAILALTGYTLPSALEVFHQPGYYHTGTSHNRDLVWLVDRKELQPHFPAVTEAPVRYLRRGAPGVRGGGGMMKMMACGMVAACAPAMMMAQSADLCMAESGFAEGMDGGAPGEGPPISVRSNFDPLALFAASVITNQEGKATVHLKLPDSLTSYRIWAFATWSTNHFGQAESSILAQLPLTIRPSIPRFLNFGDKAVISVVVNNQHPGPQQAIVAVRGSNVRIDSATSGYVVRLGAKRRAVLNIPVESENAGIARFQFALSSSLFSDATELSIPVWTPATTEAFATYGEILDGTSSHVVQPLVAPSETKVFPQFGGVEITTSSTALSSLTDAYIYLSNYPYECVEQITSRALATVALEKVLRAFGKAIPSEEEILQKQQCDLNKLKDRQQQSTGGFGWWTGNSETSPFLTVHVAHLVQRLFSKSLTIPIGFNVNLLKQYLRHIDNHFPSYYPIEYRNSIKAYSLYVLKRFKELSKEEAVVLYQTAKDSLSLEGLGWLLVAIDDPTAPESEEILNTINKSVEETAETAHFVTNYNDTGKYVFLTSSRRTDGILLEALLDNQFVNGMARTSSIQSLIPKLAKGLLANKKQGRWGNTQENCFILLALNRYFEIFEASTPNYSAKFWMDNQCVGDHTYHGRSLDNHLTHIPMSSIVVPASTSTLVTREITLAKEGAEGILYYRFGVSYAPLDLNLKPSDQGFEVTRNYEAVDDPSHVRFDSENKSWHFKSGERVRVKLSLTNASRRYHVALVDKLPAGLEPINPSLKTAESLPQDPTQSPSFKGCFFFGSWFEHQNFRDERVEAFASLLFPGQHGYSYVTRATAKGTYVVPPAQAEEMYSPEIFGRTATEKVVIY